MITPGPLPKARTRAYLNEGADAYASDRHMTDQSPNKGFHDSSFLQGHNQEYVEHLHASYARDPASVDASWAEFFASLGGG